MTNTWIDRLNNALDYIEGHLDSDLAVEEIAARSNSSAFHFQRMFSILCDVTLAEYIRRRRLTMAATDLLSGSDILDTALKYGYESRASFSRAYRKMHGFTPGKTRESGRRIQAFPPMSFTLNIRGVQSMDYEIRSLGEFTLEGVARKFSTMDGENLRAIPRFWQEANNDPRFARLFASSDAHGICRGAVVGACLDAVPEKEEFVYLIGVEPGGDGAGFERRLIPAQTWAVFRGRGTMPDSIQETWKRIFGEWFPATDYEHAGGPELEIYPAEGDSDGNMPYEVWIPVKKKGE